MGHSDHWRCIFPDLEKGIAQALDWVPRGPILGRREDAESEFPGGVGANIFAIGWPQAGLRGNFVIVHNLGSGRRYLHTVYPAAASGCKHAVRVDSIQEASWGLEARVSGRLGEAAVTFFDPLYCLKRNSYRPGELHDVELAAIAYSIQIVPPGTTVQTRIGDVLLDWAAVLVRAGDNTERLATGDEHAFGVAYIEQAGGYWQPDDYEFYAPVKSVEEFDLDGIAVWKFRATVLRTPDGEIEFDVDIYATRQAVGERALPKVGDEIAGRLWLQGTLA
jgi:hypothetical protein